MTKSKRIVTIIAASLFSFLSILMLFWYFGGSYNAFFDRTAKEFSIQGLSEGFTPQGITYDSGSRYFLTCGYMKDGSASRIYVTKDNRNVKYFTLKLNDEDYSGHAGGITTNGKNVWISGESKVFRFNFDDIISVKNKGVISIVDFFETKNGADFITTDGEFLWVGEFHREGNYTTDTTHHFFTSNGKTNKALSFKYAINENSPGGINSLTPVSALSTKSLVQGMAIINDKLVLSTSYSLADSHLYVYNNITINPTEKRFKYDDDTNIPLYILEDDDMIEDIVAPCMSEEIVYAKNKVYVLFESACKKYGAFTRNPLRNVYSFEI